MSRLAATITGLALVPALAGLAACSTTDTTKTTAAMQNPVVSTTTTTATTTKVVSVDTSGATITPPAAASTGVGAVFAGDSGLYALASGGGVTAWGVDGQPLTLPGQLTGLRSIDSTPGAEGFTLAVTSDGRVVGQPGTEPSDAYDGMVGRTGMKSVSAGSSWAVGLTDQGTVVATGTAPAAPADLTGVKQVTAGGNSVLAVKNDGTLAFWSKDANETLPTALKDAKVVMVASDPVYSHAAILANGQVYWWSDGDPALRGVAETATSIAMGYDTGRAQPVIFVEKADGGVSAHNPVAGSVTPVPSMTGATALAAKGGAAVAIVPSS